MQELRGTTDKELQSVIDLTNWIFRTENGFEPTMHLEYPLLLGPQNMDNIRIIIEDGRPVSTVSYLMSNIQIEGVSLCAASVGAVCTHPDYRGRNYATYLMDDVEERILRDGVEVMLVSGNLNLYRRRGCTKVGGFQKADLGPLDTKDSIGLLELTRDNMEEAARMYHQEPVRYIRSFDQFVTLHESTKYYRSIFDYKSYIVTRYGKAVAYIVARIQVADNAAVIREFAGDRRAVIDGAYKFLAQDGLNKCTLIFPRTDIMGRLLEEDGIQLQAQDQQGTIKIMNYPSLMNSLKPYMRQYLPGEILDALIFTERDGKYYISLEDETLLIDNRDSLGQLIFGSTVQGGEEYSLLQAELADMPKLKDVIDTIFPVPFPWTQNLNYI